MKYRMIKALTVIFAFMLLLSGCNSMDYKKAVSLYEDGAYSEACEIFTQLGDYKISEEYVVKCKYELAMDDYEAGEYENALAGFTELGNFRESADYADKCQFRIAMNCLETGEYEKAIALFTDLGDYSESKRMLQKANYSQGLRCMELEDYHHAKVCFAAADDWEDSQAHMFKASGMILRQYLQNNGTLKYNSTDQKYKVTLGWDDETTEFWMYMGYTESSANQENKIIELRAFFVPGETQVTVECFSHYNMEFGNYLIVSTESVDAALDFGSYDYGDKLLHESYEFSGHYWRGNSVGTLNRETYGLLYKDLAYYVELMIRGVDQFFRENEIGITIEDMGFLSLNK